jgi:uncharacterized protein YjbI with pentapeptide repeats
MTHAAWTPSELETLYREIEVDRSNPWRQRNLPASPHGLTASGLADFRGLPFRGLVKMDIVNADFTKSRSLKNEHAVDTGLSFHSCRALRTVFDNSGTCEGFDGIFDHCSLNGIRGNRCHLVGLFRDCQFLRANLKRAHLRSNFVRCRFEGCNLDVASWGSSFEDCTFVNCKISPIFQDVADYVGDGKPVTFSMLTSWRITPGETAAYFSRPELLHGWERTRER